MRDISKTLKPETFETDCIWKTDNGCGCILIPEKSEWHVLKIWNEFVIPQLKLLGCKLIDSSSIEKKEKIIYAIAEDKYKISSHLFFEWTKTNMPSFPYIFYNIKKSCVGCIFKEIISERHPSPGEANTSLISDLYKNGDPDLYQLQTLPGNDIDGGPRFVNSNGRIFRRQIEIDNLEDLYALIMEEHINNIENAIEEKEDNGEVEEEILDLKINKIANRHSGTLKKVAEALENLKLGFKCSHCGSYNIKQSKHFKGFHFCLDCCKTTDSTKLILNNIKKEKDNKAIDIIKVFFEGINTYNLDLNEDEFATFERFVSEYNLPYNKKSLQIFRNISDHYDKDIEQAEFADLNNNKTEIEGTEEEEEHTFRKGGEFYFLITDSNKIEGRYSDYLNDPTLAGLRLSYFNDNSGNKITIKLRNILLNKIVELERLNVPYERICSTLEDILAPFELIKKYDFMNIGKKEFSISNCKVCGSNEIDIEGAKIVCHDCGNFIRDLTPFEAVNIYDSKIVTEIEKNSIFNIIFGSLEPEIIEITNLHFYDEDSSEIVKFLPNNVKAWLKDVNKFLGGNVFNNKRRDIFFAYRYLSNIAMKNYRHLYKIAKNYNSSIIEIEELIKQTYIDILKGIKKPFRILELRTDIENLAKIEENEIVALVLLEMWIVYETLWYCEYHGFVKPISSFDGKHIEFTCSHFDKLDNGQIKFCHNKVIRPSKEIWKNYEKKKMNFISYEDILADPI